MYFPCILLTSSHIADGYTTDDILYLWKPTDPVQIAQNLSLPRFSIENYASSYCNVKTNTGKFNATFVFASHATLCAEKAFTFSVYFPRFRKRLVLQRSTLLVSYKPNHNHVKIKVKIHVKSCGFLQKK